MRVFSLRRVMHDAASAVVDNAVDDDDNSPMFNTTSTTPTTTTTMTKHWTRDNDTILSNEDRRRRRRRRRPQQRDGRRRRRSKLRAAREPSKRLNGANRHDTPQWEEVSDIEHSDNDDQPLHVTMTTRMTNTTCARTSWEKGDDDDKE